MKRFAIKTADNGDYLHQLVDSMQEGDILHISPPKRSLQQNALLWPCLEELSKQVNWYGQKLSAYEWKDVMTAGLKKTKVVPGIDGGVVICGQSTSDMSKAYFSELIELIYAFGAEHGVKFKQPIVIG